MASEPNSESSQNQEKCNKSWQEIAQEAQRFRDASIAQIQPPVPLSTPLPAPFQTLKNVINVPRQVLTEEELRITETTTEDLVQALAKGRLKSVAVVRAFLRRAGVAQALANCVTEVMPQSALDRAQYLDDYLAQHGKPVGPLHGLPISVKEHIAFKGRGINCGFVDWYEHVADVDALVLTLLEQAGAVFYVRTSEPQCLMHLETSNNLYGETVNPYNRTLTSGGSSGGEGVILALRGSCLGIGSDIGGSIRSPAGNCGVWGYKPTSGRIPLEGVAAPMEGYEQIVPTLGPLSTSFQGLHLFSKAVIDQKPWYTEPSLVPLPWRYPSSSSYLTKPDGKRTVKVGVMWSDRVVKPHPPISRALREAVNRLSSSPGFEIVDWQPLQHDVAWEIISSLYFPDGAQEEKDIIAASGEPWHPLSRFIIHEQPGCRYLSIADLWALTKKRDQYRSAYASHWNATGANGEPVDVILCPVGPGGAPPLDHSRYWAYTSQWNLLDYPAIVFPVGQVDQQKDQVEVDYRPKNAQDEYNYNLYAPERYVDAPISLQLVGRRYEDEKLFEAMEMIKAVLLDRP